MIELVCSNKPRPSVQKGPKGNQHWRRDVHHARHSGKLFTLCHIEASDWLVIDSPFRADDPNLCKHCARVVARSLPPTQTLVSLQHHREGQS